MDHVAVLYPGQADPLPGRRLYIPPQPGLPLHHAGPPQLWDGLPPLYAGVSDPPAPPPPAGPPGPYRRPGGAPRAVHGHPGQYAPGRQLHPQGHQPLNGRVPPRRLTRKRAPAHVTRRDRPLGRPALRLLRKTHNRAFSKTSAFVETHSFHFLSVVLCFKHLKSKGEPSHDRHCPHRWIRLFLL